ncbi:tetratricopeptide (TPR) repeat protein/transposase-like protein [Planomicrobium sp. HSC-17F08]|nr:tetratricopeptide (TPR) repeat protein/transposase-like protein [Planomicrobium sp. HSC-17F08]
MVNITLREMNESEKKVVQKQRVMRVFISSTFRDMFEEREELIKYVFPVLRKMCEERGVIWGEVDLRWGVTDEQSADGKVLPICLAEIENCRPFFIGILGERYGWIPEISAELILQFPWLKQNVGKSVTELEILHGALLKQNANAFFYFRDPSFIQSLSPEKQQEYLDTIPLEMVDAMTDIEIEHALRERSIKLAEIKDKIKQSGFRVRDNFRDAKELGKWVLEDFSEIIENYFPKNEPIDEVKKKAYEHEIFALSRSEFFEGRTNALLKMDEFFEGESVPLIITGESGLGKSSLLSYWSLKHLPRQQENYYAIYHFVGEISRSADVSSLMSRIILELNQKFELDLDIPKGIDLLREQFALALNLAAAKGKVLLVIDAINQLNLQSDAPDLFWLPTILPKEIRLIISTTPGNELKEFEKRNWDILQLEMLSAETQESIIHNYLSVYGKSLPPKITKLITRHPNSQNPLFLKTLLEEIRIDGDKGDNLEQTIVNLLKVNSIQELFMKKIERLERDYNKEDYPDLVCESLTLLWASHAGLIEEDLLRLLSKTEEKLSSSVWSPLFLAIEGNLQNNSGYISLFHEHFRAAVEDKYLYKPHLKKIIHKRLANYYNISDIRTKKIVLSELPWQWKKAEEWNELYLLLQNLSFSAALWEKDPFEVKEYWSEVEQKTKFWEKGSSEELTMVKGYAAIIEQPANFSVNDVLLVAKILEGNHLNEALSLHYYLSDYFKKNNQVNSALFYMGDIAKIYQIQGRYQDSMKLLLEQERLANEYEMPDVLQGALGNRAKILLNRGRNDEAMKLLKEQELICSTQVKNDFGLQQSLGNQAKIHRLQYNYSEALELLTLKEEICSRTNNRNGLQEVVQERALNALAQGDLPHGLELLQIQEKMCRSLGMLEDLQSCLGKQASALYDANRKNKGKAIALITEQELICFHLQHMDGQQSVYHMRGKILKTEGKIDSALNFFHKQEIICRDIDNSLALQECLGNQGFIYLNRHQYDLAWEKQKEQEEMCRKRDYLLGLQISLALKGSLLRQQGQIREALKVAEEQAGIIKKLGNRRSLYFSYTMIAWCLKRIGKIDKAYEIHHKQEEIAIELDDSTLLSKPRYERANLHFSKGEYEKALKVYSNCIELSEKNKDKQAMIQINEKINKVKKAIVEKGAITDKEIVDFLSITMEERFILLALKANSQLIFKGMNDIVRNSAFNYITDKDLNKIIFFLRYKGLVWSYKGKSKKTIYKLSDLGSEKVENVTEKELQDIIYVEVEQKKEINSGVVALSNEKEAGLRKVFDEIVFADSKKLGSPLYVKDGNQYKYLIFYSNAQNLLLTNQFEYIYNKSEDFYLVSESDMNIYSQLMPKFYRWLKKRNGKVVYEKNIYITSFHKLMKHDNPWQKIILTK